MAIHNFNYTYKYIACKTMPVSFVDTTQIVKNITVEVTAEDKTDSNKTLTEEKHLSLQNVFSYKYDGLPSNFIKIENLTEEKIIEWFQANINIADLDIYFTWQIYGVEEVSPIPIEAVE